MKEYSDNSCHDRPCNEQHDYIKWQREYFDSMSSDKFYNAAVEYDKAHPFDLREKQ